MSGNQALVNNKKTKFYRGDGNDFAEVFEFVAEVTDWSGMGKSRKSIDVTTLEDDYTKVDEGGVITIAPLKLDALFDANNPIHETLEDDIEGGLRNWQMQFANGQKRQFCALVTNVERMGKKDDKIRMTVTLDISGKPFDPEV